MAVTPAYKAFVEELFSAVMPVRIRAMFGGAGIYSEGVMFGLIADERVYLKASELTRADFAAEGCGPFVWVTPDGKEMAMGYFELPDRLYDEPEELKTWAMKALDAALLAKKKPAKNKRQVGTKRIKPRALTNRRKPKVISTPQRNPRT